MPRSAKDIIKRQLEDNKIHVLFDDSDFLIAKTPFATNNNLVNYESMILQRDISDEGWVVKQKVINGLSYNRKPYITTSLDLFDIIRCLSKKAYILFTYIIKNININSNKIVLTPKDVMNIINEKYYTNANKIVNELIRAKLIDHSANDLDKNTYCINHQEYFKGNFAKFINTHNKMYGVVNSKLNDIE